MDRSFKGELDKVATGYDLTLLAQKGSGWPQTKIQQWLQAPYTKACPKEELVKALESELERLRAGGKV